MRKYLFLILFGLLCFLPFNVHAATTSRAFTGNAEWYQQQGYYYGLPDVHNGVNGGYLIDDVETKAFPSNSNYYLLRSLDTNNGMIYVLKQLTLRSSVSVENGKVYSVQLMFAGGSALRYGNEIDTSLYNISNDSECFTDIGTCTYYWTNDHYAIITLVPNRNSSNYYIRLGNQANEDKALVINTYTQGFQGIEIRSSSIQNTDSSTDIGPLINQQQITNLKLDDINNNINNTNNKIDDTNEKLDSIGDTLADTDVPSSSDINSQFELIDVANDGPISSLINLPLQILNIFRQALTNNTCQTISLGSLYGKPIQLTCWTLNDSKYTPLGAIVTSILVVLLLYRIFMALVSFFDSITSLEDVFDIPYKGKHVGYKPKHGGDD